MTKRLPQLRKPLLILLPVHADYLIANAFGGLATLPS